MQNSVFSLKFHFLNNLADEIPLVNWYFNKCHKINSIRMKDSFVLIFFWFIYKKYFLLFFFSISLSESLFIDQTFVVSFFHLVISIFILSKLSHLSFLSIYFLKNYLHISKTWELFYYKFHYLIKAQGIKTCKVI